MPTMRIKFKWLAYLLPMTLSLATIGTLGCSSGSDNNAVETVAAPTASLAAGTYTEAKTVALSCTTAGASIHYTLNGSDPTASSTLYAGPINVAVTTTIKAIALMDGMNPSAIMTATYTINLPAGTVATPTANPPGGTYGAAQTIVLSTATPGAAIRYTANGSDPTASSALYAGPINVAVTTTIKAIALMDGMNPSAVMTATYTINLPAGTVATPTANPPGGTYSSAQTIVLSTTTPGAAIRYTANGSDPTASSTLYAGPINVAATTTIKAIALMDGMNPSAVMTATYTIISNEMNLLGKVVILQAYGTGDKTDGGVSHSFIELYNKSGEFANLSGHWLQYSTGGASWTNIDLNGRFIPAGKSFLVMGKKMNNTAPLQLDQTRADILLPELQIDNNLFKIFLVKSENPVTVVNPFDFNGDHAGVKAGGYTDLLGTNDTDITKNIDAFETSRLSEPDIKAPYYASKGKSVRRITLNDTDDNERDFERIEWRAGREDSLNGEEFAKFQPRSAMDDPWDPVYIRIPAGDGNANIGELKIVGQTVNPGTPAVSYDLVTSPGAASITSLVAGSAPISLTIAPGATFRTAKATGNYEPQWNDTLLPVYSFANGDFLYIEVRSANGVNKNVYKVAVNVTPVEGTITVGGPYTLSLNSTIPRRRVSIEAHANQAATNLVARADATLASGTSTGGTWSMLLPAGQQVWFRVEVTDETGYAFGKVVSGSAQTFNADTNDVALVLGGFAPPELNSFTLLDATATQGAKGNKTGAISNNAITFDDTSFETVAVNTIIRFDNLVANFTLSQGNKLYVGDVEQISGVTGNNYYKPVAFTVVSEDNARKTYTVAGQTNYRIVGTRSFQTQGFGVMNITTTDKTTGLPPSSPAPGKLNNIWNTTGTYTYIGPEGRILAGVTDVRARGNHSFRADARKSYAMKLPSSARVGFDYYDYKTQKFITLPPHRRWVLLAHETDASKIRTTTGYEMGRHVLTSMGWQPHGDFVFFFLNDEFKGVYIISEDIRIDEGRLDITPTASTNAAAGGWVAQMNNFWWYAQDISSNTNSYIFDELYNFMTSHQNPSADQNSAIRQQGVVWSIAVPDEDLGWYEPDPPGSTGSLDYNNTTHMPRKGFALMATLGNGSGYNRASSPLSGWVVPNDFGQTNGMGTRNMLRAGTFGQNNGGFYGDRTIGPLFQAAGRAPLSSLFAQMAEIIQNAEDAVYARNWGNNGVGGYHDYIDIASFIDWQIATEMTSNFELSVLNGLYMHYDPNISKLKMGPIWDLDKAWGESTGGGGWWTPPVSSQAEAGFVRKSSFWYKELLGWEITGNGTTSIFNHPGRESSDRKDPYYTQRLKARWNEVKGRFITELGPYIDAQYERLQRIGSYSRVPTVTGAQTVQPSNALKTAITNRITALDTVISNY